MIRHFIPLHLQPYYANKYGYRKGDFHDFIKVTTSAISEIAHWQLQGYALVTPVVMEKKFSIEEIR